MDVLVGGLGLESLSGDWGGWLLLKKLDNRFVGGMLIGMSSGKIRSGWGWLVGTVIAGATVAGCSSGGGTEVATNDTADDGGVTDSSADDSGALSDSDQDDAVGEASVFDGGVDTAPPAFSCDLPAETPTLQPETWQHPNEPVAGQALTLIVKSGNTKPTDAPKLVGELTNRNGTRQIVDYTMVGGANAFFYVTFSPLAQGENCLVLRNGNNVEVAKKIVAPAPKPVSKGNGVWKVTSNHQWTCDEEPEWGNFLRAKVLDENGNPVPNAKIDLRWTDDVVYPVKPDDNATTWEQHGQPKSMTTNDKGEANMVTPWGEGIRTVIDGKKGMIVFRVSVAGGASDVATEITSALWEETYDHCNYCSKHASNVYGHWSYTVTFQRVPDAKQVCEVGIDHAGQKHCSYSHFFHDPDHPSCLPVAP